MKTCWKFAVLVTVVSYFSTTEGIRCLTCDNARTNSECLMRGKVVQCRPNEHACHNEIRTDDRGLIIKKRCKEMKACTNNFIQNPRAAWKPTQCNLERMHTVCRCCCYHDDCNLKSYFCLGEDADCQPIGTPKFGSRDCEFKDRMTELGSLCKFSCDEGYELVGATESKCRRVGKRSLFSHPPPACVRRSCPPKQQHPLNGVVECTDENRRGSVCTFQCDPGYMLQGIDNMECTRENEWTNDPPICISVRCYPPQEQPVNGRASCTNLNIVNSLCRFECDEGYILQGSPRRTCRDDGDGDLEGLWSNPTPTCQVLTCADQPAAPEHGAIVCSDGSNYLSTCEFTCDVGYAPDHGNSRTCVKSASGLSAEWDNTTPVCRPTSCDPAQTAPVFGSVLCSNGNQLGSVCDFECDTGYQLRGASDTECVPQSGLGFNSLVWSRPAPTCVPIVCQPPHADPANGAVSCTDSNRADSVCSFSCAAGFALVGASKSACRDDGDGDALGLWTEKAPVCRPIVCLPPHRAPINGEVDCTDANSLHSACRFSCDAGYQLIGPERSVCNDDGDGDWKGAWSAPAPRCIAIMCPPPHVAPANGAVACTNANYESSECSFTCRAGYRLIGAPSSTCLDDGDGDAVGAWTQPAPTCQVIQCFPVHESLTNGGVSCTNENFAASVCSFTCNSNFFRAGAAAVTCDQQLGSAIGEWSDVPPTCQPVTCSPKHLDSIANGNSVCTKDNFATSVCSFSCDAGYAMAGSPESVCSDDADGDADGVWSDEWPTCGGIVCIPPLTAPVNGDVACSKGNALGSECGFTCDEGFARIGSPEVVCEDDGNLDAIGIWSDDPPICTEIICPIMEIENGNTRCSRGNRYASSCTFTCNPGYNMRDDFAGSPTVCNDDFDGDAIGQWSRDPPVCEPVTCLPPSAAPLNGNVDCTNSNYAGSECAYGCGDGYFLAGSPSRTCVDDVDGDALGEWTSPEPVCQRITCEPAITEVENGAVICSNENKRDSSCSFTCGPGFALIGPPIVTCEDDDDGDADGLWDNDVPTCRPITCKPPHSAPANGAVACSNSNFHLSECAFTCELDYVRVGSVTSKCLDDGDGDADGVWDEPAPVCERRVCDEPPAAPENGFRVCTDGNFLGSQCEYGCDEYHRREGPLYSTCVSTSRETQEFDNDAPVCVPNECPNQSIKNGAVQCTNDNLATSTCSFTCDESRGYELYPPEFTVNDCLNDTTWNVPAPCCTRDCPPYAVMDLAIVMDSSSSVGASDWVKQKTFVRGLISRFVLGEDATLMSVFRYNKKVDHETEIKLDRTTDMAEFLELYDQIPYDGSGTRTGNALQHVLIDHFAAGNGNRPGVKDVVFIITDGKSQDDVRPPAEKLREKGTLIFAVGIGMGARGYQQLVEMAGSEEQVWNVVGGFEELGDGLAESLGRNICGEPCS